MQRGLPIQLLVKYFTQNGDLWQINAELRGMVQHRQLNLLQDFSHLGTFDIIFCRNVLIYFDQNTKVGIFERMSRMMEPDGVLALGAAESVVGITNTFKPYPDRRGLYRPNIAPVIRVATGHRPWRRRPCGPSPRRAEFHLHNGCARDRAKRSRAAGSATCCR